MNQQIRPTANLTMEPLLRKIEDDPTLSIPGLFVGMGRLGASCFEREFFKNWQSLSRSQSHTTYQRDLISQNLTDLPCFKTIVFACAPKERTEKAYIDTYITALKNVLQNCSYQRMIFCSSTAVYAEHSGGWVDEESPKEEQKYRGVILLEAESLVKKHSRNHIILRFTALCETYNSTPVALSLNHWSNRITRDKAAFWVERANEYPGICQEIFSINERIERVGEDRVVACTGKRVRFERADGMLRGSHD